MPPYDAILFDFDGVLVDSEPLHFACWRDVAARIGLTIDWDWYQRHAIGVSDREMIALVSKANVRKEHASEGNARPDLVDAFWNLFDEKKRLFAERIVADVPMPPEVRALLRDLHEVEPTPPNESLEESKPDVRNESKPDARNEVNPHALQKVNLNALKESGPNALKEIEPTPRKLPIAVVSTSFRSEVEPALIAAGVRNFITTLVCGDDVQNLKPHPEPYLTAAQRLNATNPLVVEDSDPGAAAAQAAGFQVLRVKSPHQTPAVVRAALNR